MPKPTPSKTRVRNGRVSSKKDPALVQKLIEEKLAQQKAILERSDKTKEGYSYQSPFYGASFQNKSFQSEADFLAYVEWREEEISWSKEGVPLGQIHQILRR